MDGLLCERKQDTGPTVVYHLYDDPVKDAIPVDRSESELQGSMLKFIHRLFFLKVFLVLAGGTNQIYEDRKRETLFRKRAVYFKQNFNLAMPSVKSCEHCIIIEVFSFCLHFSLNNSQMQYFSR